MLILPDQTYEEDKEEDETVSSTPDISDQNRSGLINVRRQPSTCNDDLTSVMHLCEQFLTRYHIKPDFFCKYRVRNNSQQLWYLEYFGDRQMAVSDAAGFDERIEIVLPRLDIEKFRKEELLNFNKENEEFVEIKISIPHLDEKVLRTEELSNLSSENKYKGVEIVIPRLDVEKLKKKELLINSSKQNEAPAEPFEADDNKSIVLRNRKRIISECKDEENNLNGKPAVKRTKSSEKLLRCSICRQKLDDSNLKVYSGHPVGAVDEFSIREHPQLNYGNLDEETNNNEHPGVKITCFTIYDKNGHLCSFHDGLIERNVLLYFSGYIKPIYDEVPTVEGGFPAKDLGPIIAWWLAGFDGGENVLCGISTDHNDYYLMEASAEYAPLMKTFKEKIYLAKYTIEFLQDDNNESTYEDLLNKLESTAVPADIPKLTEETLLQHAEFIHDQVQSYDSYADVDDDILMTKPCMQTLLEFAGITETKTREKKKNQRFRSTTVVTEKSSKLTKATTTYLVQNVFENFFPEQLATHSNRKLNNRKTRCQTCIACQQPDCGICQNCLNMVKFGGSSTSEHTCIKKRCINLTSKNDTTLSADDEIDETEYIVNNTRSRSGFNRMTNNNRNYNKSISWKNKLYEKKSKTYYKSVIINNEEYNVGDYVLVEPTELSSPFYIGRIIYMWENNENEKWFHTRWFYRSCETVLGETGNPQEIFICDECDDRELFSIANHAQVVYKPPSPDFYNLGNCKLSQLNTIKLPNDGKSFFYEKWYTNAFARFETVRKDPESSSKLQQNFCSVCEIKRVEETYDSPVVVRYQTGSGKSYKVVKWKNEEYRVGCCVFLKPGSLKLKIKKSNELNNVDLKKIDEDLYPELYRKLSDRATKTVPELQTFDIGYITKIYTDEENVIFLNVNKFYRPEQTCKDEMYIHEADLNLLFWSDEACEVDFSQVTGKCYVKHKININKPILEWSNEGPYRFYFEKAYNCTKKKFYDPPDHAVNNQRYLCKDENENANKPEEPIKWPEISRPLRCFEVFSGCGGLAEGLHQAKISDCKWALEIDENAANAFRLNNPKSTVFTSDCNEFLKTIIENEKNGNINQKFPKKGEVELLCGGPPCQGFSGMNRFTNKQYSKFKNSLVVSFLSYCDYYRPKYFILENVRNFLSFNKSMVLKLTIRCLLRMGYQCAFAALQAGSYGVPQLRRRAIVIAAAPNEILPNFPEPIHVLCPVTPTFIDGKKYDLNWDWRNSTPYRKITVRDAISDLPSISLSSREDVIAYDRKPRSHYQRLMRMNGNNSLLRDHVCKEFFNPIVEARIREIPKCKGADWRNLPNKVVRLSDGTVFKKLQYLYNDKKNGKSSTGALRGVCKCATGAKCSVEDKQANTLIPWCLPHTANRYNNWAGLYGRLDWNGVFPTTITIPEPMSKQGRVLHPEQDRVISVRECARSQGFPDSYHFYGTILDKHRQIGNAVPPPLATAIGREIAKAVIEKNENNITFAYD